MVEGGGRWEVGSDSRRWPAAGFPKKGRANGIAGVIAEPRSSFAALAPVSTVSSRRLSPVYASTSAAGDVSAFGSGDGCTADSYAAYCAITVRASGSPGTWQPVVSRMG